MRGRLLLAGILAVVLGWPLHVAAGDSFTVLAYHDVVSGEINGTDVMTIDVAELIAQFTWIKEHGYQPVGLDHILAARDGRQQLPDKAVLLTFDDGYRSVYTHVYPLLRLFNYPAVIALVGDWMESVTTVRFGEQELPRERFLTWHQVREMTDSGLVEVASHSYDLHRGAIANPQGNEQPAVTRLYDTGSGVYETEQEWLRRIRNDLSRSVRVIERHTGIKPRAMIWPYGSHNRHVVAVARDLGMSITMNLDDGNNDTSDPRTLQRLLIPDNATLADLIWMLRRPHRAASVRVMHVDLDYVYDPDPVRQEHNLGLLLDRVRALGVNTVYLQAFADPDGDGSADALYFPNRHLPVRADLFNRVAWQLRTRAGVRVYAWMPVLAFDVGAEHPLSAYYVQADPSRPPAPPTGRYNRLSPFHPDVRRMLDEIYTDLAVHASFAGILFHDDAMLADFEDASPWALDHYAAEWGLPASIPEIRQSAESFARWSAHKSRFLAELTDRLTDRVRQYHPAVKTARNLFAGVVLDPAAESWLAQSLPLFIEHYDYTAIMAMPYLEGVPDPERWLLALVERVAETPGALDRTVFELQSVDWRTGDPLDSDILAQHLRLLLRNGVRNFGYYPDDFIRGNPDITRIMPHISLNANPFGNTR